ncbi:DUF2946 domain-containing protein [Paucibacter sp. APW11]|uniref:DUF2946 domain-containing protein n=1 Tax=Roseateles aquae TaxID=3077235 RepID=A0ABU3PEP1_9BURK|nr:DUF2946 domain-containing protein [Paucibacter sp. APW11]MDT9001067.1 DUF2946 domain-containing protein [Paucibacter sp. APW11]
MFFRRRLKHLVSWIASLAILLAALAPALSHALQRDVPGGWTEICTVTGAKLVKTVDARADTADAGQPASDDAGLHGLKHCPYCATHSTALGLPPAAGASPLLLSGGAEVPELFLLAPRTLFAWASAQPRAPPLKA